MPFILILSLWFITGCSEESIFSGTPRNTKPQVKKLDRLALYSGDKLSVEGMNLEESITVKIGDNETSFRALSSEKAEVSIPELSVQGASEITFTSEGEVFASFPVLLNVRIEDMDTVPLAADQVCDDILFKNEEGVLTRGLRSCGAELKACSSAGEVNCRTVTAFPSFDTSDPLLVPAHIKNGVTIAGISGIYPSAAAPLTGATSAVADLTTLDTASPLGSYEFFDSAGSRYTGSIADGGTITPGTTDQTIAAPNTVYRQVVVKGDLNLAPVNIKDAVTLFAVTGVLTGAPPTCSSDGQISCLVDGTNYAAGLLAGAAGKILSGTSLAGVSGNVTLPSAVNVLTGSGLYGNPSAQLTPSYSPDFPSVANVRSLDTVDGAPGTLGDCTAGNQSGCVSTPTYRTMDLSLAGATTDLTAANFNTSVATAANFEFWDSTGARSVVSGTSNLSLGNVKSGVTIFGVTGDYPSATYTLPSASATPDLDAATDHIKIKSSAAFEYWNSAGVYQTGAGNSQITANNIVSTATIFGVTGNLTAPASIDPWNVRVGSVINGVTGQLKTSCRNRANTSLWDSSVPYTAVDSIDDTLTITGHLFTSNMTVRVGASTAPTGLTINSTTYYVIYVDANTIRLSATSGPGTQVDITGVGADVTVYQWSDGTLHWWDTIDDYNGNLVYPTSLVSGWSSDTDCNYSNWQDLTADGICNAAADDCIMKDRISGLTWSESYPVAGVAAASTTLSWQKAIQHCNNLSWGGSSGWRLATQKELQEAYIHGIRDVGHSGVGTIRGSGSTHNNNQFISSIDSTFWSASAVSSVATNGWQVSLHDGSTNYLVKSTATQVLCVK